MHQRVKVAVVFVRGASKDELCGSGSERTRRR